MKSAPPSGPGNFTYEKARNSSRDSKFGKHAKERYATRPVSEVYAPRMQFFLFLRIESVADFRGFPRVRTRVRAPRAHGARHTREHLFSGNLTLPANLDSTKLDESK